LRTIRLARKAQFVGTRDSLSTEFRGSEITISLATFAGLRWRMTCWAESTISS